MFEMTPKCDRCHHRLIMTPADKFPAMVGFQLEDGNVINLCRNCIEDLGRAKQEGKTDDFFKELGL